MISVIECKNTCSWFQAPRQCLSSYVIILYQELFNWYDSSCFLRIVTFQSLKNIPLDDVDFGFNVPEETEADIDDFENQKFVEEQENKIIETEKLEKPLKSAKVGYICISIKSKISEKCYQIMETV